MSDPNDELEVELRNIFKRSDAVPKEVTEFAKAALGWRRLNADLAELLSDSALETHAVSLARGTASTRSLTFRSSDLTIDLEIKESGGVLGQLAPATAATVETQGPDGNVVATTDADELGRFRLTLEPGARFRLRIVRPDGASVETSWFSL